MMSWDEAFPRFSGHYDLIGELPEVSCAQKKMSQFWSLVDKLVMSALELTLDQSGRDAIPNAYPDNLM